MAVIEKPMTMDSFTIELFEQSIFKRNATLFGREVQVHVPGHPADFHQASKTLSPEQACMIHSEMLIRSRFAAASLAKHFPPLESGTFGRCVINIGQRSLLDIALIEDIIATGDTLFMHDQILVVVIDERPLTLTGLKEKRIIISHLYLLKDAGIEIALLNYDANADSAEILNTLNMFNYLLVDMQKKELHALLNADHEHLNKLYDQMNLIVHTKKIRFIAVRIESKSHYVLARSLPFDCFQGNYFSAPKIVRDR